jgi:hypothetical protein
MNMGLLDSLFGGKKAEAPAPKPAKAEAAPVAAAPAAVAPAITAPVAVEGLTPEVVAAICASIGLVLEDGGGAELAAVMAAVLLHSKGGGCRAVRFKRKSDAWAANGRLKIMDGRQMF